MVTALLFAGRAGSTLTAEIGLMKATEQLASLEMIGVDPPASRCSTILGWCYQYADTVTHIYERWVSWRSTQA